MQRAPTFAVTAALTALFAVACTTNLQQHTAFGSAPVTPDPIEARVGDLVSFEVRPPVANGSNWMLECHGRARFADDPKASALEWTAQPRPLHMETIVSPWDPIPGHVRAAAQGWLWFGLRDHGESEALDRELPIRRVDYRDVAPVTFTSSFSIRPDQQKLSFTEREGRIVVTYLTPTDLGVPRAPSIDAMLVETAGKRVLYAEVKTDFGTIAKEKTGYEVTLSYPATVAAPVEVVVVGWVGHGSYFAPFTVDRLVVDPRGSGGGTGPGRADARPCIGGFAGLMTHPISRD